MDEMTITSAQYNALNGVNGSITATIDGTEMSVPLDPANRHYSALLEWAEQDGNTIQEAD